MFRLSKLSLRHHSLNHYLQGQVCRHQAAWVLLEVVRLLRQLKEVLLHPLLSFDDFSYYIILEYLKREASQYFAFYFWHER